MSDRPTHALTVRPFVVELPLWAVWRAARPVQSLLDAVVDAYRDADPVRRSSALAVALACLLVAMMAVSAYLLLLLQHR